MATKSKAQTTNQVSVKGKNPVLSASKTGVKAGRAVRTNAIFAKDKALVGLSVIGGAAMLAGGVAWAVAKGFGRGIRG